MIAKHISLMADSLSDYCKVILKGMLIALPIFIFSFPFGFAIGYAMLGILVGLVLLYVWARVMGSTRYFGYLCVSKFIAMFAGIIIGLLFGIRYGMVLMLKLLALF